ncbi:Trk potassium uptake system protein TrkH [hydrothermal vent metagenome]|uniref:Trk potassium uptake system protein TrkH n=1 Tax=hydrothermal vent metagenome TaxID=652676 RepID=A0A3B0RD18_9ZZZZ
MTALSGARKNYVPVIKASRNIEFDMVFLVIGLFLMIIGVGMFIPAIVDAAVGNPDWQVFAVCASFVTFIGGLLFLSNKSDYSELSIKQGFLITVLAWVAVPMMGALPFVFSDLNLSYTDAFFEAMSGITTTGSTVVTGLDGLPPGILLWRSLLQWFGGVGIIVMGVGIMPLLQIGGMQLFRVEAFDVSENFIPRATQLALSLSVLYMALTLICAVILWMAGMTPFEAANHAFTTLSTGGFSTSDGSVGHFDSAAIDYIISLFMVLGSLPFILQLKMLAGYPLSLVRDSQVRWFIMLLVIIISILSLWLWGMRDFEFTLALRQTTFNVISVITGTGYASTDYTAWGMFSVIIFFFIMFIGGCAGSTSCGVKIFRVQIMVLTAKAHLKKILWPNIVSDTKYKNRTVSENVAGSVFAYLFLFIVCLFLLTMALTLTGLDFTTALSGAGTAMANVGPGVGELIGPAGNFQTLPDTAKWLLSFGMLLGRLELFAVLVLFSPQFWRY